MTFFAACAAAALSAGSVPLIEPLRSGESGLIVRCGKVLTMDGSDRVLAPGVVVVRNKKIEAVEAECPEVEGFTTIELKSNHLSTARDGAVACEATLAHGGRTTQVWDVVARHEETGRVLALFRCTQLLLYPR